MQMHVTRKGEICGGKGGGPHKNKTVHLRRSKNKNSSVGALAERGSLWLYIGAELKVCPGFRVTPGHPVLLPLLLCTGRAVLGL